MCPVLLFTILLILLYKLEVILAGFVLPFMAFGILREINLKEINPEGIKFAVLTVFVFLAFLLFLIFFFTFLSRLQEFLFALTERCFPF